MNTVLNSEPATPQAPRKTSFSKRLVAKSVLSNWSYLVANVLVAFWMTPFVVHHLGNSAFGIWALVLQLTGYMGVVDVGLKSALVRFVSRFQAQNDQAGLHRLLNGIFTLTLIIAPICIACGGVLAIFALPHMHIPPELLGSSQVTLVIGAGIMAADLVFAIFHGSLAGLSRWDKINAIWLAALGVRTALIVVALKSGFSLVTLAAIQLSTNVAGFFWEVAAVRRLLPMFRPALERPERARFQPILQHSWYSLLLGIANKINYQVDSIVIAAFLPVDQVAFYMIGFRLIEYLREMLNSAAMIIAPLASALEAVGEDKQVGAMLVRSTKYSLIVGFVAVAGLLGLGTDFIRLWMGPSFAMPSGTVLIILALGQLASGTQFMSSHILFGLSKHRLNLVWTVIESILNLGLSLALVRRYGIFGVAAGTTISTAIIRGWFFPRGFLKLLNVGWGEYLRHGVMPAVAPACAFFAGTYLYRSVFSVQNYGVLFAAALCGLILCLPALWVLGLDPADRQLIRMKSRRFVLRTEGVAAE